MNIALGFRTHSGWAAVVAIAASGGKPQVCDRRMIVLSDADIAGSKQPYHAAELLPAAKATEFLRRCTASTNLLATESVGAVVSALKQAGHEVAGCGMTTASGRMPATMEEILASHAAIHTAEGELYRNAIARACESCNLPLTRVAQKNAWGSAEKALGLKRTRIEELLNAAGKKLGPPWTEDQKLAALAAWVALATPATNKKKAARTS